MTSADIARYTSKDRILTQVLDWVRKGWPLEQIGAKLQPYQMRQHEHSMQKGGLLWGSRVVVSPKLQEPILKALHEGHPGVVRMKELAQSYVWWPKLDQAITEWVARCPGCQQAQADTPRSTIREWENPKAPWSRLHIDFASPLQGHTFLVVVDAYSKWVEAVLMSSSTSEAVVKTLQRLFMTHGLLDAIVLDNSPQLTAGLFQTFLANQACVGGSMSPCRMSGTLSERL